MTAIECVANAFCKEQVLCDDCEHWKNCWYKHTSHGVYTQHISPLQKEISHLKRALTMLAQCNGRLTGDSEKVIKLVMDSTKED